MGETGFHTHQLVSYTAPEADSKRMRHYIEYQRYYQDLRRVRDGMIICQKTALCRNVLEVGVGDGCAVVSVLLARRNDKHAQMEAFC